MKDKAEKALKVAKKIRYLALASRRIVLNRLLGAYRSAFQGRGMEFFQVRPFQVGDEVRYMDWNVTARMRAPYVKTFQEEHALAVLLVVDVSGSMDFGSSKERKCETAAEVAALIAFAALENRDQVGLLLFAQDVELYLPPGSRKSHVMRILREILTPRKRSGSTDMSRMLYFLGHLRKQPDLCFLISDLQTALPARALRVAAKRSDWIALQIHDPLEESFPHVGLVHLMDCETGQTCYVDSSHPFFQRDFMQQQQKREKECATCLKACGIDLLNLSTDVPYDRVIERFFAQRERKRRA